MVGEVKKDCCAGREVACRFGGGDVLLNLELHGFDNEVIAVWGADGPIEREEVAGEFSMEGVGHVAGNKASDCGGDTEWLELGGVVGVLVETEEVNIGEVSMNCGGEVVLVYLVEDVVEVSWHRWNVRFHEVDEKVDGVGIDARPFVSVVGDSVADVAWECVLLCGGGWRWVVLGWDG